MRDRKKLELEIVAVALLFKRREIAIGAPLLIDWLTDITISKPGECVSQVAWDITTPLRELPKTGKEFLDFILKIWNCFGRSS